MKLLSSLCLIVVLCSGVGIIYGIAAVELGFMWICVAILAGALYGLVVIGKKNAEQVNRTKQNAE